MEPEPPFLLLKIIYDDDDLIKVESRLIAGDWSGRTRAYASATTTAASVEALAEWAKKPSSSFILEVGKQGPHGWIHLRFQTIDKAGHIVCYAQLADMARSQWLEEDLNHMGLQMQVDPVQVEHFAVGLKAAASSRRGESLLAARDIAS